MTLETFFENFEQLAAAPNGVQKMRKLILQLAAQGKLVPQDPNDEPTSALLKKIRQERERLVKEKKIRKSEPLPRIEAAEAPFDLPQGWEWVRLQELGEFCGGMTPSTNRADYWDGEISWVSPKDMKSPRITSSELTISELALVETRLRLLPKKSVLIVARSGILKRTLPVAINEIECAVNQDIKVLIPYLTIISDYLQLMLRGHEATILKELVKGGMTVQSLKYDEFEVYPFPLPPLAEQRRIVAKVEQLMALCDDIEARQQNQQAARVRLNNAALDRLLMARALEEFAERWHRICDNFDLLYDAPETVGQLRQCVLQLAMQGKLVPQDPNDDQASVLLEKIRAEKERLIQEKKIRKSEPLLPIEADERPFDVPRGWEWVRLDSVCALITDGAHHTPNYVSNGVPFLSVKDVSGGRIDLTDVRYISKEEHEALIKRCNPEFGDLLFTKVGTTGIAKVIDVKAEFSIFVSLALLKLVPATISPEFLERVLNSPHVKKQSEKNTQGVGNKNLVLKFIKGFVIPVAPLAEQSRIVAKVNQLMALCDELEAKLKDVQTTSGKLLEATVKDLLMHSKTRGAAA